MHNFLFACLQRDRVYVVHMENYDCFLSAPFPGLKRQECLENLCCLSRGFKSASGAASEAEGWDSQVAKKDTFMLRASPGTKATSSLLVASQLLYFGRAFMNPLREKVKNKRPSIVYDQPKYR